MVWGDMHKVREHLPCSQNRVGVQRLGVGYFTGPQISLPKWVVILSTNRKLSFGEPKSLDGGHSLVNSRPEI